MPNDSSPALDLQLAHLDGCAVIHCMGRLLAEQAGQLEMIASRELYAGRRVILDLNGVIEVDRDGMDAISHLYRNGLLTHCPVVILGGGTQLQRQLHHVVELDAPVLTLVAPALEPSDGLDDLPHSA